MRWQPRLVSIIAPVMREKCEASRFPDFWRADDALPKSVRERADKNYALLKQCPTHPSLHFKMVGALGSVRVGLCYRARAT